MACGMRTCRRLQVYHLPGSTNIWWPPTSMMAYVAGAAWESGDGWYLRAAGASAAAAAGAAKRAVEASAVSSGHAKRCVGYVC